MTDLEIYSAYLPYKVKVIYKGEIHNIAYVSTKRLALVSTKGIGEVIKIKWEYVSDQCKLILRPLSDLTKLGNGFLNEHEINQSVSEKFNLPYGVFELYKSEMSIFLESDSSLMYDKDKTIGFRVFEFIRTELLKNHFDVFGLIEQGKAIDINETTRT